MAFPPFTWLPSKKTITAELESGPSQIQKLLAPWSLTYQTAKLWEIINFCDLSHQVYGVLLQQLQQTKTGQ